MNFKKTIYSLISAGIFAGCLCQPVSAESMERILKESDLLKISKVRLLISRFGFDEFCRKGSSVRKAVGQYGPCQQGEFRDDDFHLGGDSCPA